MTTTTMQKPRGGEPLSLLSLLALPLDTANATLQNLAPAAMEDLRSVLWDILGSPEKRHEFLTLQKILSNRTDITQKTLHVVGGALLKMLVSVKTGIQAFLHPDIKIELETLREVFFMQRCQNMAFQSKLPSGDCTCRLCSRKSGFCSQCMCIECHKFDFDINTCRWIGCDFCLHWCHTDCAISKKRVSIVRRGDAGAGPSDVEGNEALFLCSACNRTSELFGFVKDVFLLCAKKWDSKVMETELECVVKMLKGCAELRARKLLEKASAELSALRGGKSIEKVCEEMLAFFSDKPNIHGGSNDTSQSRMGAMQGMERGMADNGEVVEGLSSLSEIQEALLAHESILREKRKEAAALVQMREAQKWQAQELESVARSRAAESERLQKAADEAKREVEVLRHIIEVKIEKNEEEYKRKRDAIELEAAEAKFRKLQDMAKRLGGSSGIQRFGQL